VIAGHHRQRRPADDFTDISAPENAARIVDDMEFVANRGASHRVQLVLVQVRVAWGRALQLG